jgi:hypothetical protein
MRSVSRSGVQVEATDYDEEVHLRIRVRKSLREMIERELTETTSGTVKFTKTS